MQGRKQWPLGLLTVPEDQSLGVLTALAEQGQGADC